MSILLDLFSLRGRLSQRRYFWMALANQAARSQTYIFLANNRDLGIPIQTIVIFGLFAAHLAGKRARDIALPYAAFFVPLALFFALPPLATFLVWFQPQGPLSQLHAFIRLWEDELGAVAIGLLLPPAFLPPISQPHVDPPHTETPDAPESLPTPPARLEPAHLGPRRASFGQRQRR